MISVFGAAMAVHFSPKDLGLGAGVSGTVFSSSNWIVLGNSKMNRRTIDWPMCAVCVISKDK